MFWIGGWVEGPLEGRFPVSKFRSQAPKHHVTLVATDSNLSNLEDLVSV